MATGQLSMILRYVHNLASEPSAEALSDADLLDRFAAGEEEAAFAALVRRHGPMVLGVCRRVLDDLHDAEDAFQATFLVLLRKAGDLKKSGSIAGWLYTVAYHAALKAKSGAVRRNQQQRGMTDMPAEPDTELLWRDLQPVLDEELNRLPEKYRDVVAQCYLEGKTCAEAGKALGCRATTVKSRLARARHLLRQRLTRRGATLSSVVLTAVLAERATAAVPLRLLQSTIHNGLRSLTGNAAGSAAALAEGVMQTMFSQKIKTAITCVVLAGVVALTVGLLIHQANIPSQRVNAAQPNLKCDQVENVDRQPLPPGGVDGRAGKSALPKKGEPINIRGRVLDRSGKPLSCAVVAVVGAPKRRRRPGSFNLILLSDKVLATAKSTDKGHFRVTVPGAALNEYERLYVVAGRPGYGMNWQHAAFDGKTETVVHLPKEMAIHGELRNLQGLPAAGVTIKIWQGTRRGKTESVRLSSLPRKQFPYFPGPVTTGKDGKFVIHGVNPLLTGGIQFQSDEYAMEWEQIAGGANKRLQIVNKVLQPAQIIEGVVLTADHGTPVANAEVMINSDDNVTAPFATGAGASGRTDAKGHYRINPPAGKLYTVRVTPPAGQYHLRVEQTFKWTPGAVQRTVNLSLPAGVMVRGKVTEAGSGKPVADAVIRDTERIWINPYVESKADGSFAIAVKPGKSHLIIKGPHNAFVPLEVTHEEIRGGKRRGSRFYPDALVSLDLKKGTKTHNVSVQLNRGVTIRGTLIGPDGIVPKSAVMMCWNQVRQHGLSWFNAGVQISDGKFELRGCDPKATYKVYFLDAVNRYGATVQLSAKKAKGKPVTVNLLPCGSATARFVDAQGNPAVGFQPIFYFVARKEKEPFRADDDFAANIDRVNYGKRLTADAKGRITFPALIPGAVYRVMNTPLRPARDIIVQPGGNLTLPDIPVAR